MRASFWIFFAGMVLDFFCSMFFGALFTQFTVVDLHLFQGGLFDDGGGNTNEAGDVLEEAAEAGTVGLRNLGNTCYMNSGLQVILSIDKF